MKISICIPTFNRAEHLRNCLKSLEANVHNSSCEFEICISDNCSSDETPEIVREAAKTMDIVYSRNSENIGIAKNFLRVISMASGEFAWLIGNDDLLLPDAINRLDDLISSNQEADYFFVNSYHLNTEYVLSYPQPFDLKNLPEHMETFSKHEQSGPLQFLDLIDPRYSFDFLGGMFLSVFRRSKWLEHVGCLRQDALDDPRTFSHFDNTFPHLKVFANAFAGSQAYFEAKPFTVCLTGAREWSPMYPLVHGVRLIEALAVYRKVGLPFWRYVYAKNFGLSNFIPELGYIIVHREKSGFQYINIPKLLLQNALYPNLYLSVPRFLLRKLKQFAS